MSKEDLNLAFLENWANSREGVWSDRCPDYYLDRLENGEVQVFYAKSHILYGIRLSNGHCIIRDIRSRSFKDEYTDHLERLDNVVAMHHALFDSVEALPDAYDIRIPF